MVGPAVVARAPGDRLRRVFVVLGVLAIALGRFQIPGVEVPLTTVVLLIAAGALVFVVDRAASALGLAMFALLAAVAATSTLLGAFDPALPVSIASLAFLVVTYASTIVDRGAPRDFNAGLAIFNGTTIATTVGAALALLQYGLQAAGRGYLDVLAAVPAAFFVPGYNTYYDLRWAGGSAGEFKPNGMIFLEPSFLSIYTVIAMLMIAGRFFFDGEERPRPWDLARLAILAGGFAVSASASGLAVLAIAAIPFVLSIRRRLALVPAFAAVVLIAASLGLFSSVGDKASEGFAGTTSAALRLTLPYQYLIPVWSERPWLGWGAGTATPAIQDVGIAGLQVSTLMKVLVDYGLVGALVIAAIVTVGLRMTQAPSYLVFAILASWLVPSDSLLNGTIAMFLLVALPTWRAVASPPERAEPPGHPLLS